MKRLKTLTAGLIAFTLAAVVSGCKKTDETKNDNFINSLAVVRFSEGERVSRAKSVAEEVFFRDENSVKNYLGKISGGKADYTTVSLEICELKTSVKRYLPAYKSINGRSTVGRIKYFISTFSFVEIYLHTYSNACKIKK